MVSHYRQRVGRALTHNDGAHNEHTKKQKWRRHTKKGDRQKTDKYQLKTQNQVYPGLLLSCFPMLSHHRASTAHPIRSWGRHSFPIRHRTSGLPARMLGPSLMLAASYLPARSLGLGLTLARTTNSPLIRPNKSQMPSNAYAGPRPYTGLNQT